MLAILAAAFAHLGYGIGDVYGTFANRKIGSLATSFWVSVFNLLIFSAGVFFFWDNISNAAANSILANIGLALILSFSFFSFNHALKIGNAPLVGTITGSFPVVSVALSIIVFNESPSLVQIITMLIIFAGIILSSLNLKEIKRQSAKFDKAVILSLFTMMGWGIYFSLIRGPIENYGWFWAQYITVIVSVITFFIIMCYKGHAYLKDIRKKEGYINVAGSAILTGGATFAFNYALSVGSTSVVAPIAGSYPALFAVLSYRIFKEHLTTQQKLGIALTLLGVIGLSIVSA